MIISRIQKQCGHADFGWLQAQYTFSFGHYFDPDFINYASLRVIKSRDYRAKSGPSSQSLSQYRFN
ncbi:MAG: hypothetical protein AB8W37_12455 [Arsenophonus endosymbiont of Dermacentor nuttalli]